jgi:hypothetical protein
MRWVLQTSWEGRRLHEIGSTLQIPEIASDLPSDFPHRASFTLSPIEGLEEVGLWLQNTGDWGEGAGMGEGGHTHAAWCPT